ncbi:hypothetical protein [Curtobacterium flaccumfaciens]|uniref:hypothetical protein n=1 Tax=Curtobacterium flaccumfaciens TaxID=2035 RepID=UPI0039946B93
MNRVTLLVVGVAGVLAAVGAALVSVRSPIVLVSAPLPVVLLVVAALIGVIYAVGQYQFRTRETPLPFVAETAAPPKSADVDTLRTAYNIGPSQAAFFLKALLFPREVFQRIGERAESFSRSIKVTSTFTVQIMPPSPDPKKASPPDGQGHGDYVIPLHLPTRDSSVDGLRVTDSDGKRTSTLDSRNQTTYIAACIRLLLDRVGTSVLDGYRNPTVGLEQQVLDALSRSKPMPDRHLEGLVERVAAIAASNPPAQRAIRNLLLTALRHQIISVTIPAETIAKRRWPHTFRYTVEYRTVTGRTLPGAKPGLLDRLVGAIDVARLALGVPILRMYLLPNNALRTRSYHAELHGPPGTYYAKGEVLAADDSVRVEGSIPLRHGQRRAHFHLRGASWASPPILAASFAERAPGSFATTSMASIAAAVVLWLLSAQEIAMSHLPATVAAAPQQQPWLLPALLAVPVAAVGLSGLDAGRHQRHPSLLSRTINLIVIVISLAGFVMASLETRGTAVPDILWLLLRDGIAACAVISVATWTLRLTVENRFIRQSR